MKRLLFILLLIPTLLVGQQPFYGNRSFISLDGNDTLNLRFSGDTIYFESTDSVYFDKLLNIGSGGGGSLSVGTDGQIPYTNPAGDDFIYNDYLKYDGNKLKFNTDTTEIKGVTKADTIVSDVIKGAMQIAKAEVLYTNTSQTTIVTLPENAVVWHFGVEVNTIFNDSGTDYLELGTSTNSTEYDNNVDLGISNFFFDSNISFSPDRPVKMTSSTDITFKYAGQNSDATTGQAFVYIHYTIF